LGPSKLHEVVNNEKGRQRGVYAIKHDQQHNRDHASMRSRLLSLVDLLFNAPMHIMQAVRCTRFSIRYMPSRTKA
jgi:hypothetical protein